jgi:hypothetical protein
MENSHVNKKIVPILSALLMAASLAACKPAPSGGNGGTAQTPNPGDTCGGYSWCTQSPSPRPLSQNEVKEIQADTMGQCKLLLDPAATNGIEVFSEGDVEGILVVRCLFTPTSQTLLLELDWRNPDTGNWETQAHIVDKRIPLGGEMGTSYVVTANPCRKGIWSMLIKLTGLGYQKVPYYTVPGGVRTPPFLTDCTPSR